MKTLIYDCEIVKAIPPRFPSERVAGVQYCNGWTDYTGMGISVIAAYDYVDDAYHVFLEDNFHDFAMLVQERDCIVGFNSSAFDDKLCEANGIEVETTYDLLCEVRAAVKQPRSFTPGKTKGGYKLEQIAQANLGEGKTASGEAAPLMWQSGKFGAVIDYCLQDVRITKQLLDLADLSKLKCPVTKNIMPVNKVIQVYSQIRARNKGTATLFDV